MKPKTLAIGVVALSIVGGLPATQVLPVNLVQMVQSADRIFLGVCAGAKETTEASTGMPVVEYTFVVKRGLKGTAKGDTVVFRQINSKRKNGAIAVVGVPQYSKGAELLVFLHGDSRIGLTSPVGLSQGLFRLQKLSDGSMGVINSLKNGNLAYNLTTRQVTRSKLGTREMSMLKSGQPIPLDAFADMVAQIESSSQAEGSR